MVKHENINVSFISSYPPRVCGIATFTQDLASSLTNLMGYDLNRGEFVHIIALNNNTESYIYGNEVAFEIKDQFINNYKDAAYYLNLSSSEIVNLQHEFGLYGGEDGSNILTLVQNLNKPLVTTLHTILKTPTTNQLRIIKVLAGHSSHLVVQSMCSLKLLENVYKIPREKIAYIPHGGPDVPFLDPAYYKDKFKLSNKKVILTFGLLGPGKGIEDVIDALPDVVKKYPNVTFVIVGATHPNIKKIYGEEYRNTLENLVKKNSLENHVIFINKFVSRQQLLEFLLMSDIYVSAYQNAAQIVSGTLTYALACGKAVISTPYWYAEEMLKEKTGILVPFKDPEAISKALKYLLGNETKRNRIRKEAYDMGRNLIWSNVALQYLELFNTASKGHKVRGKGTPARERFKGSSSLPEVNLNHLINFTDSTGVLQHATFTIPNRNEGYCTDDNVRALLVAVVNKNMFENNSMIKLINIYMSFLLHAYNTNTGLYRNFMTYDRRWLEETGSEDSNARVIFVLGYIIKNPPFDSCLFIAKNLFDRTIENTKNFSSPRAMALLIHGCILYLSRFSGAREIGKICKNFAEKLSSLYVHNKDDKWKWFEPICAYSNGRIPHAMLLAGNLFKNSTYITQGLESLKWLFDVQYDKEGNHLSLIGNKGWFEKGKEKAKYDQQPVEIPGLIDACYQAYKITKDDRWIPRIEIIFSWFLGNNDRKEPLYDYLTGGCYDGLTPSVTNLNQGAESTVSWLLALHRMIRIQQDLNIK